MFRRGAIGKRLFVMLSISFLILLSSSSVIAFSLSDLFDWFGSKDPAPVNVSNLRLVGRDATIDYYFNDTTVENVAVFHVLEVNMLNLSRGYEPYEDVTSVEYDGNDLILSWNNKSVRFEIYTIDSVGNKERLKDKSLESKNDLNFETTIEKRRGSYYYNHTLTEDKSKQPSKIGYNIITSNVTCREEGYNLVCDEQKVDFSDAVNKQNLIIDIDTNLSFVEFSGDDLSYIDPTFTAYASDGGSYGCWAYRDSGDLNYDYYYCDSETGGGANRLKHGWEGNSSSSNYAGDYYFSYFEFPMSQIKDSWNISQIQFKYYEDWEEDSSEDDTNFYEYDEDWFENGNRRPFTASERQFAFEDLNAHDLYATDTSPDEGSWNTETFDSDALDRMNDNVASGDTYFYTVITGDTSGQYNYDYYMEVMDELSGYSPELIMTYTIPDTVVPITLVTPNGNGEFADDGAPYSFGTIGDRSVNVSFSCIDFGGDPVSGCSTTRYCNDTANSCTPSINYTSTVTISTTGTSYIRFNSTDEAGNSEEIKSETIVIDTDPLSGPVEWSECDPADPCCDSEGNIRGNGYVCKSAHDLVCGTASTCSGTANEDRCDGTSSLCPDSNDAITYNEACDNEICGSQSCSDVTLQPERTCLAGTCQTNNAYLCPDNLKCADATSCKLSASSSSDCADGFTYDSGLSICWSDEGTPTDLQYDDNGNLIDDGNYLYTYNGFNYLVNVTTSGGTLVAEYLYDDSGQRIKTMEYSGGSNTNASYFDGFVSIVNSSGSYNETYYYYYDKLAGKKDVNGNFLYYHPDLLGSTALITDGGGNKVESLSYEPFGELANDTTTNELYTFTGYEQDTETSLLYAGARYYDSEIGQFIQPDNVVGDIYDPQNLNKYGYARNNPLKYTDPDGEFFDIIFDIGFVLYDIGQIIQNPTDTSAHLALTADLVGTLIPGVTGLGIGIRTGSRAARTADRLNDVGRVARGADRANDVIRTADRASDVGRNVDRSSDLRRTGDNIEYADPRTLNPSHSIKSEKKVQTIKQSMQTEGFVGQPIEVATTSGGQKIITQGHHRTRAAIEAGLKKVPIVEAMQYNYPWSTSSGRIVDINKLTDIARGLAKRKGGA